jgi:hypothetical protein
MREPPVETITHKGATIRIYRDTDCENPRTN